MELLTYTARMGTAHDARAIHQWHRSAQQEIGVDYLAWENGRVDTETLRARMDRRIGRGWAWLGAGSYRHAYMSPDGVVYKVNRGLTDGYGSNSAEAHKVAGMDNLPLQVRIPAHTLYDMGGDDSVLAMQAIDTSAPFTNCYGNGMCYAFNCTSNEGNMRAGITCSGSVWRMLSDVIYDAHADNVFPDMDGYIWICDAGY